MYSLGIKIGNECDIKNDPKCCFDLPVNKCSDRNIEKIELKDGNCVEVRNDGTRQTLEKAKVNLHDCLSCGGCPNAEVRPFIKNEEVWEEFYRLVTNNDKIFVISISPQSRCSLASYFNLTQEDFIGKLITSLSKWGIKYIFDISFSRELSLIESAKEFLKRKKKGETPLLSSACPGWISYAETSHGDFLLPYIATTKSPQQIMGSLIKRHFSKTINTIPSKIFHTTIMPCLDKRMESSRDQFFDKEMDCPEVDFVLTTKDLLKLLQEKAGNFLEEEISKIDSLYTNIDNGKFYGVGGGPSDGFLEYVFKKAASELYGINVSEIKYTISGKTNDFKETTLEVNGKILLRFAAVYGFRNIQTIVRQIKNNSCTYDYVEVMACPSGCTNGGGQIESVNGKKTPQQVLEEVNSLYNGIPVVDVGSARVIEVYKDWINDDFDKAQAFLHTSYHKAEIVKLKSKTGCKCSASIDLGKIW